MRHGFGMVPEAAPGTRFRVGAVAALEFISANYRGKGPPFSHAFWLPQAAEHEDRPLESHTRFLTAFDFTNMVIIRASS